MELSLGTFNLRHTLECGQVFRWKKKGDWHYGVVNKHVIKVRQCDDKLIVQSSSELGRKFIESYFRLDDDLEKILRAISKDEEIKSAIEIFKGLRIVRQEPWECLVSYLLSVNSNIPLIKRNINAICKKYGEPIIFEKQRFYTFPEPRTIASASVDELKSCGLGFRAGFIHNTAKRIFEGVLDLESLKNREYEVAKSHLMKLKGVGHKVADCILLFSLEKLEAFPVDRWVRRFMTETYFDEKDVSDNEIRKFARDYFGKFAGYAQEYLYYYRRKRLEH